MFGSMKPPGSPKQKSSPRSFASIGLPVIERIQIHTRPVERCELTAHVRLRDQVGNIISMESCESDGCKIVFEWYRSSQPGNNKCCVHPSEEAKIQCLQCVKLDLPAHLSYFDSPASFKRQWTHHRKMLDKARARVAKGGQPRNKPEMESCMGDAHDEDCPGQRPGDWVLVCSGSRSYTPTAEDIDYTLKVAVHAATKDDSNLGEPEWIITESVLAIPAPPPPRRVVNCEMPYTYRKSRQGGGDRFKMMSYNVLADMYANKDVYPYCEPWALTWAYRHQNILREIESYGSDIVCLQEVQEDHYHETFMPWFAERGFEGLYKRKTKQVFTGKYTMDGCAIFFRKALFELVEEHSIEFKTVALQRFSDNPTFNQCCGAPNTREGAQALKRLTKDNIALIAILKLKREPKGGSGMNNPRFLCVANTHISADPEVTDVKIWQVLTLLQELEQIAQAQVPIILAGDFNSLPQSAPYTLLRHGHVPQHHDDLQNDPCGILNMLSGTFQHSIPLVSTYSQVSTASEANGFTAEPVTNYTGHFVGCLDYLWYTQERLQVTSILETLPEKVLQEHVALPCPAWSSDHMALMAEYEYL